MRSNYFGDSMPIHQWNMSGKMHAVQGTFANSDFRDTYANQKIGCLPICYRIRDRPKQYYVMDHSFDFWSEAFVAYTAPVPAGFVLQTCAEEPDWEFVPASSWASQSSSSSTEIRSSSVELLQGVLGKWEPKQKANQHAWCVCRDRPPWFSKLVDTADCAGTAGNGCAKNNSTKTKVKNVRCRLLH